MPLPASLAGRRCLDVGTWDGFWAFEMERRGAASVTAIDIEDPAGWDWPPQTRVGDHFASGRQILDDFKGGGQAFALAQEALGVQASTASTSASTTSTPMSTAASTSSSSAASCSTSATRSARSTGCAVSAPASS